LSDSSLRAEASGAGAIVVQIVGDGNEVTLAKGVALRLTDYRHFATAAGVEPGMAGERGYTATGRQEANLLVPYTASIDLVGRAHEIAATDAWLDGPQPLSVRVLVGDGGRGKTRLALELARARRAQGWHAGFIDTDEFRGFLADRSAPDFRWNKPTLAVIDYAAGKAELVFRWLQLLLRNPACQPGSTAPRLRLLLLDRAAARGEGWWQRAFGHGDLEGRQVDRLVEPESPRPLGPIGSAEDRRAVFAAAFRIATGTPPALDDGIDAAIAKQSWGGEPLFLAMAGLYAARHGVANALALPADQLALDVAADELSRIAKVWQGHGRPAPDFARHLAALATLCGGLSRAAAEAAIAREKAALGRASAGDVPDLHDALAAALPGPEGGIAPILPDILGEAAMILAWRAPGVGAAAVARALPTHRPQVVESVVRACRDFAIHGQQAPLAWLRRILAATASPAELAALSDALPRSTVELREIAVEILEALLATPDLAASAGVEEKRAALLNNLSVRLGDLGRLEEALAASEEAVASYRRLDAAQPDAFLPHLAGSLNNLSVDLSGLGRREAALAAIEEAVAIRRRLAAARPDAFLPDLASSLNNLSADLADLGRREAALAASEEAVAVRRSLAAARPDEFLPVLAPSLNNLSNRLGDLGRREAALAAIEEAVASYRHLAAARPDAFLPYLALSLNNLSADLSNLGRLEEALAASEEAVASYRRLAAARPDAFLPDLARSLSNLSNGLSGLGRRAAALAAIEEAVAIHRGLAAARPDVFNGDLGQSLAVRGGRHRGAGDAAAARRDAAEALALLEPLVAAGWADMVPFRDLAARIRDTA
jgi:tetratricopeptide (TPR) repeat protein